VSSRNWGGAATSNWCDCGSAGSAIPPKMLPAAPAFALGDYEWILAFEAPELHRIVNLMRDLRPTDARRHIREETSLFTGPPVGVEELVVKLPEG
jgi:Chlorite dismutase